MESKVEITQELKELRAEVKRVREDKKEVMMTLVLKNYNSDIETVTKNNMQLVFELLSTELEGIYECGCAYADQVDMVELATMNLTKAYITGNVKEIQNIVHNMHKIRAKCIDYDEMISHIEYYSSKEEELSDKIYELECTLGVF